jgi:hypothetical protein
MTRSHTPGWLSCWYRCDSIALIIIESLNLSLRHEVARLIVWHVVTRPVVPSAVSYADVREGNAPYRACGHGTHSHSTGTGTVRGRCICQHQAEMGLDGWYGEHM